MFHLRGLSLSRNDLDVRQARVYKGFDTQCTEDKVLPPTSFSAGTTVLKDPIAASAAFISLLALFVSCFSIWMQSRHNRKSVRAVGFVELDDSLQQLQVRIVNKGCGPMMIKEFIADRNGTTQHNLVYHLPKEILPLQVSHQVHTRPEGYWLLPGGELILLRIEGDYRDQGFVAIRERIRFVLSEIAVKLTFCDVYDKPYPVFTKSLEWFKRKL